MSMKNVCTQIETKPQKQNVKDSKIALFVLPFSMSLVVIRLYQMRSRPTPY